MDINQKIIKEKEICDLFSNTVVKYASKKKKDRENSFITMQELFKNNPHLFKRTILRAKKKAFLMGREDELLYIEKKFPEYIINVNKTLEGKIINNLNLIDIKSTTKDVISIVRNALKECGSNIKKIKKETHVNIINLMIQKRKPIDINMLKFLQEIIKTAKIKKIDGFLNFTREMKITFKKNNNNKKNNERLIKELKNILSLLYKNEYRYSEIREFFYLIHTYAPNNIYDFLEYLNEDPDKKIYAIAILHSSGVTKWDKEPFEDKTISLNMKNNAGDPMFFCMVKAMYDRKCKEKQIIDFLQKNKENIDILLTNKMNLNIIEYLNSFTHWPISQKKKLNQYCKLEIQKTEIAILNDEQDNEFNL